MAHGNGFVYRPTRRGKKLNVWYYQIRLGRRLKTGTGFETRKAAEDALKEMRKRKASGKIIAPEVERLLVEDVLESYLVSLRDREKKSIRSVSCRVNLLKERLGFIRAMDLSVGDIEEYRKARLAAGRGKSTIDREIEILRASYRFASDQGRVEKLPHFPRYGTDNVRRVFVSPKERDALRKVFPTVCSVCADIDEFLDLSGWRAAEVSALPCSWIDRGRKELTIPDSKNSEGRMVPLDGGLWSLVERRLKARQFVRRNGTTGISEFLFFHVKGPKAGRPVSYATFRRHKKRAHEAAGVAYGRKGGSTAHDYRRTFARDGRRLGKPEAELMKFAGWKSPAVFRRYSIVNTDDMRGIVLDRDVLLQHEAAAANAEDSNVVTINTPVGSVSRGGSK